MRIVASIDRRRYLRSLRQQMQSWFAFGQQRFTGIVLGSFICITSHSAFEWNRRYTCHKNRAIGFVNDNGEGSEVCVVLTAGYMDPVSILILYLLGLFIFTVKSAQPGPGLMEHIFAAAFALITAVISYFIDSFTQRGRESLADLVTLLHNPVPAWEESDE